MNEERAGREGSSRGSGGSRDAFGGSGGPAAGEPAAVPRQAEQGRAPGAGRRRAEGSAAAEFGAAELTAALRHSVSAVGASGPPRAGLARIRKRAKARQRRRTAMAGSAGVLLVVMGVAAVTGSSFDIVPVLTGVVGLGGHSTSSGATSTGPVSGGSGGVRTVLPPAAAAGRKGPAIGPATPTAASSAALAATGVPQCTVADLRMTASVDTVIGGVYGHIEAVATTTCAVAGPPVLQVENAAGTAAGSVVILRHEASDGSALPNVPTWGAVLKLQADQGYDFQFAWAPDSCAQAGVNVPAGPGGTSAATGGSSAPTAAGTGSPAATTKSGNQNAQSAYSLSYLVAGVTPTAPVDLGASCGATVYVTDVYSEGAYPLPQPPTTPTPQPPSSSAPAAPSASPTTQPPTSAAPTSAGTSPAAPSSSAAPSSQATTTSSGSDPGASSGANATAAGSASS